MTEPMISIRIPPLVAAATLALASMACAGEDDCLDLTCECASAADCPEEFGCIDQVCFPKGQFPNDAPCSIDTDCVSQRCQDGLKICVDFCGTPSQPTCNNGYVCQGNDCLPFHSLPLGSTCSDSRLCPMGVNCIVNSCSITCTNGYDTADCPDDGSYCSVAAIPVCVPPLPGCTPNQANTCPTPRVCVDVGRNLGICRHPCTYNVSTGGVYTDSCPPQIGFFPTTCAPTGMAGTSVCIEANPGAGGQVGAACNDGTLLCARGNVCVGGICRMVCQTSTECGASMCTPQLNGFPVCLP